MNAPRRASGAGGGDGGTPVDERLAPALGRRREVRGDAQPAEALPEHAPRPEVHLAPDPLGVADDRVGAVVDEALRALGPRDRARAPGAALVEHQDPVVLQRAVQPAERARVARRARALVAGAALEV